MPHHWYLFCVRKLALLIVNEGNHAFYFWKMEAMKKIRLACLIIVILPILGECVWGNTALGNGNHSKEFPSDFDRLKTLLQQPNTLSALTPDWLNLGVEQ